jgi:AcrR family transcriptional regulator
MSRTEQKRETRRRLIDAALVLSAERGFAAVSLREVAKACGIAPTGFYRHFRDLDELGLSLVDEVALALRQLVREARRRYGQGFRVKSSVEAFVEYVQRQPHLFRLLLGERLGGSSAFRKALLAEIDRFVSELSDDLEAQARAEGRAVEPGMAALAAEAVVAVVFTVGAEALDLPKHRLPALTERIVREVYLVLRGAGLSRRHDAAAAAPPAPARVPAKKGKAR